MDQKDVTVIICCAGMGTRLGIGTTKALVRIDGKSIISRQLELLENFDDIRIVVGYQAEKVIEEVNRIRKDIMFAFNYNFQTTGVADSLKRGLLGSRKYILYIDGDVVFKNVDFMKLIALNNEYIAISKAISDEPIMVEVKNSIAISFFCGNQFSWPGVALLKREKFFGNKKNVYDLIKKYFPITALEISARGIDTYNDYENTVLWLKNEKGKIE